MPFTRSLFAAVAAIAGTILLTLPASAQTEDEIRDRINTNTVSLITGGIEYASNTYGLLAGDLAAVLDEQSKLRVLPIMGYGAVRNIEDMLYLRGIDIGMTHSDVLKHLELTGKLPAAQRRLRLVSRLYDEVFHLVARKEYASMDQLKGKKVAIGPANSGADMSCRTLLQLLKRDQDIELVNSTWSEALAQLKSGEVAAIIYTTRSPSKAVAELASNENLHLLPIPSNDAALGVYDKIEFTSNDYPGLIPVGQSVDTLHFHTVLAVFNWQPGGARYAIVRKFIEQLFAKFDQLKEPQRNEIWRTVDLSETAKGWERYAVVQELLDEQQKNLRAVSFEKIQKSFPGKNGDADEFLRFVQFMRKQGGQTNVSNQELLDTFINYKLWTREEANRPVAPVAKVAPSPKPVQRQRETTEARRPAATR